MQDSVTICNSFFIMICENLKVDFYLIKNGMCKRSV